MGDSSAGQTRLLLNASVLVFLFRALAGARTPARRQDVAKQLLSLLGEFVSFDSGTVLLGRTEEELASQFDDPAIWNHLNEQGPLCTPDLAAIPIYANSALTGALILRGALNQSLETLSAVASLASVAIESVREVERLRDDYAALEQRFNGKGGILGQSPAIVKLLDRIEKLSARDTTVLIQGESGTGKELVARLLHRASPRAEGPFVAINCAAIADSLLESELFGHEKGAFTGAAALKKGKIEMAEGGTLFLDEIGELAPALQAKLLRVLQEREFERVGATRSYRVDIRIIAATNRDLAQQVRDGGFRTDLYHRLNVITLRTPPLRERKEDIGILAGHFLRHFGEQCKRPRLTFSPEALRCMENYDWPGNVRELENAIEHAVVLGDSGAVLPSDLPDSVREASPAEELGAFESSVTDAKRDSIRRAYQQAGGDYKGAARILGLHPNYLLRLVRNLGLRESLKK
jgi:Nif-specific regulatory protein